jgi:hypothetical protein
VADAQSLPVEQRSQIPAAMSQIAWSDCSPSMWAGSIGVHVRSGPETGAVDVADAEQMTDHDVG